MDTIGHRRVSTRARRLALGLDPIVVAHRSIALMEFCAEPSNTKALCCRSATLLALEHVLLCRPAGALACGDPVHHPHRLPNESPASSMSHCLGALLVQCLGHNAVDHSDRAHEHELVVPGLDSAQVAEKEPEEVEFALAAEVSGPDLELRADE